MNREALFSDGTSQYLVPSEPKEFEMVTIRFRTAKKDVEILRIIMYNAYIHYQEESTCCFGRKHPVPAPHVCMQPI